MANPHLQLLPQRLRPQRLCSQPGGHAREVQGLTLRPDLRTLRPGSLPPLDLDLPQTPSQRGRPGRAAGAGGRFAMLAEQLSMLAAAVWILTDRSDCCTAPKREHAGEHGHVGEHSHVGAASSPSVAC